MLTSAGVVIILVLGVLFAAIRILPEYERGVVFRLGRADQRVDLEARLGARRSGRVLGHKPCYLSAPADTCFSICLNSRTRLLPFCHAVPSRTGFPACPPAQSRIFLPVMTR